MALSSGAALCADSATWIKTQDNSRFGFRGLGFRVEEFPNYRFKDLGQAMV